MEWHKIELDFKLQISNGEPADYFIISGIAPGSRIRNRPRQHGLIILRTGLDTTDTRAVSKQIYRARLSSITSNALNALVPNEQVRTF